MLPQIFKTFFTKISLLCFIARHFQQHTMRLRYLDRILQTKQYRSNHHLGHLLSRKKMRLQRASLGVRIFMMIFVELFAFGYHLQKMQYYNLYFVLLINLNSIALLLMHGHLIVLPQIGIILKPAY
jgi:hypothetical protein